MDCANKELFLRRLRKIRCFILDMDGTFYLGNKLIDGALEFIELLKKQGKSFIFLTNNSSKSAEFYVEKLKRMGCAVSRREVFTSGEATAIYLNREKKGKKVFLLGTEHLRKELEDYGIPIVENDPDIVVVGFDTTLTYDKLNRTCHFIRSGILYIATHPDLNCPTEAGMIPDCGAIIAFIEASTGRRPDLIIGKPHEEIIRGIFEKTGLDRKELAIVGDRLYTDIATGVNSGILSILVLSGETKLDDIKKSSVKPDLVFKSLKEIFEILAD